MHVEKKYLNQNSLPSGELNDIMLKKTYVRISPAFGSLDSHNRITNMHNLIIQFIPKTRKLIWRQQT